MALVDGVGCEVSKGLSRMNIDLDLERKCSNFGSVSEN